MRRVVVLLFLFCFCTPLAFAFCNTLLRLVCAEYANSKAVVIAKLIRTEHFSPRDPNQQDWFIYTLN
jgi:hypothetical protein